MHLARRPLPRRTLLKGTGVAAALPWLEAMAGPRVARADAPRRLVYVYFPNGCSLPGRGDEDNAHWRWFPKTPGAGEAIEFTDVLAPLEPFKGETSLYGGRSHPKSRALLGHLAGDTWLTGGDLRGARYDNRVSVDQVAARTLGAHTRVPSLTLSTDGGVGYKSRVSTLSFDGLGRPIPSEHRQRAIFERYFAPSGGTTTDERRSALARGKRVVDLVLEDSKRLRARLGAADTDKLDEYLAALARLENQIERNEAWLEKPLGPVDAAGLQLDPNPRTGPAEHLRATFDLIVLALRTDLTRVVTYMMGREDGMGFADAFPKIALGMKKGHHTISHDTVEGHWAEWGAFDRWFAEQFAYFLGRLAEERDAHGRLLDSTLCVYGSACSTTHNARNYPTALVGGRSLGVRHGAYRESSSEAPFGDVLLGTLWAAGVRADAVADSAEVLEL